MKTLHFLVIISFIVGSFVACSDNETEDPIRELSVGSNIFSVKSGENRTIGIVSGNDGYTASSNDENVVSASIVDGTLILTPNNLGSATISLKDRTNKEIQFAVEVEEPYLIVEFVSNADFDIAVNNFELVTEITNDLSGYTTIDPNSIYMFFRDEENTLAVYQSKEDLNTGKPSKKGTYSFIEEVGVMFTFDDETIIYTPDGSTTLWGFMYHYLEEARMSAMLRRTNVAMIERPFLVLCDDHTGKYTEKYPFAGVKKAAIRYVGELKQYKN